MSSEDLQFIHSTLEGFLNPNKEIRDQSQIKFNELSKNWQALIFCLTKILLESPNKQVRIFSLVAMRKLLDLSNLEKEDSKWKLFEPTYKSTIKTNLYNALISNTDPTMNSKICDTISVVAANIYDSEETWDELINYIFDVLKLSSNLEEINNNSSNFENALFMLKHLFPLINEELMKGLQIILSAFKNFFSTNNLSLRSKTVEAITEIILSSESKDKKTFKNFALNILETTLKCAEDPKAETYVN